MRYHRAAEVCAGQCRRVSVLRRSAAAVTLIMTSLLMTASAVQATRATQNVRGFVPSGPNWFAAAHAVPAAEGVEADPELGCQNGYETCANAATVCCPSDAHGCCGRQRDNHRLWDCYQYACGDICQSAPCSGGNDDSGNDDSSNDDNIPAPTCTMPSSTALSASCSDVCAGTFKDEPGTECSVCGNVVGLGSFYADITIAFKSDTEAVLEVGLSGTLLSIDLGSTSLSTTIDLPVSAPIPLVDETVLSLDLVVELDNVAMTTSVLSGYEATADVKLGFQVKTLLHTWTIATVQVATIKSQKCSGTLRYFVYAGIAVGALCICGCCVAGLHTLKQQSDSKKRIKAAAARLGLDGGTSAGNGYARLPAGGAAQVAVGSGIAMSPPGGRTAAGAKFCAFCGAKVAPGAKFCIQCSKPMAGQV